MLLKEVPLFLPSRQSDVRADFDLILANGGIEPFVHAEVDDMALLRLLALSGEGLALVSKIVVERELQSRKIKFMLRVPGLAEKYYALTVRKRFQNAWLGEIVEAFRAGGALTCAGHLLQTGVSAKQGSRATSLRPIQHLRRWVGSRSFSTALVMPRAVMFLDRTPRRRMMRSASGSPGNSAVCPAESCSTAASSRNQHWQ